MQKSVSDCLYILITKAGRGVIQFGMSSFQKASQRSKYSYLENSPKWICSFYHCVLSCSVPQGLLKHNAVRWILLCDQSHTAKMLMRKLSTKRLETLSKVTQQGSVQPGLVPGVRWQRAGLSAPHVTSQASTETGPGALLTLSQELESKTNATQCLHLRIKGSSAHMGLNLPISLQSQMLPCWGAPQEPRDLQADGICSALALSCKSNHGPDVKR